MNRLPAIILTFFGLIYGSDASAQTAADSLQFARTIWKKIEIRPGLVWQEAHFDSLFRAKQQINVLVFRQKPRRLKLAFASAGDSLKPTSWFGETHKAVAALNGTFFDVKKGGSVDLIKIDNKVIDTTRHTPGRPLAEHQQAAITIRHNRMNIVFGGNILGWDQRLKAPDVMVTGPLLLLNNQRHPLLKNAFNDNRHPRTCACVTRDKRIILLTADGRNANAHGLSLPELTSLMKWLGCRDAINLDGGGSTTLWIRGQPDNGVVNYPSDNKIWDHFGERPVSNVLLLLEK